MRWVALTCGLIAWAIGAPAQAFYTPGQFGVSPTGAANYTIPIAIQPGTAGMVPSLSINYNSQAGNGLLGVGWSLSGLSAITRCPKTKLQDGIVTARAPVTYTSADKYCLDGQRLVLFAGTYGANVAEYRTEGESFSRIISYGVSGSPVSGPLYFKVRIKAGLIMEYGNSADSQIAPQGKNAIQAWALNKVSDTKGNYYTISYQDNSFASGECYPTRIDYTGNDNVVPKLLPYNSVRFVYETRTDNPVLYDSTGSKTQVTKRLINIQTYAKENGVDMMVKDYRLTYAIGPATKRSRITKITECDNAGTCLPATTITWDATGDAVGNAVPKLVSSGAWYSGSNGWAYRYMGDFNGDGKTDMIGQWSDIGYAGMKCTGLDTSMSCPAITLPLALSGRGALADFNLDGYDDFLSDGTVCWGPALTSCAGTGAAGNTYYVGNVNGDQYPDVIYYKATYVPLGFDSPGKYVFSRGYCLGPNLTGCVEADIAITTSYQNSGLTLPPGVADITVGDFNGDGKTDFMYTQGLGTYLCSGEMVGSAACTLINNVYWSLSFDFQSGDFNGDGISDLYLVGDGGSYFCPGPGIATTGNNCQLVTSSTGWKTTYRTVPGDYNGDGVTDLYLIGTGNSFFCPGPGIATANNCAAKVTADWKTTYDIRSGDFDGDGTSDLFLISTLNRYFVEAGAGKADRVSVITNGLGAATTITYKPLTDATVYTKGTGANVMGAGYMELQAPMYVVASATSSNGVGGTIGNNYYYWRARAHLAGGGFMGFEIVRSCDTNTKPICTQTSYTQDYPHQGLVDKVVKFIKNGTTTPWLNYVDNTWGYRNWSYSNNSLLGTIYHVPTLNQTQEVSYELASSGDAQGALITNVTTTNTYDAYGNPLVITASMGAGTSKVTTNTYDNDTTSLNPDGSKRWLLGRLRTATVSSTAP